MAKLRYIDHRTIFIPKLKYHGAVSLPGGDNIIQVTDKEERSLLNMKNGNNPCFEKINEYDENIIEE